MNTHPAFRELIPGTPEHKDFITDAIVSRNFAHLAALKNRTDKTIHIVNNWFYYSISRVDSSQDIVVIYSEEDKQAIDQIVSNNP